MCGWRSRFVIKGRAGGMAEFVHQGADAFEARGIVRLAKINGAADLRVHLRAAQFFGRNLLADGGLHKRRPGEKQARTFRHQNVIAHHGQIRAARDAHAHDRGDLRDAHRAHHGVVAEHAAEIVRVRENVLLQRQENARRIDEIQSGNSIVDRDILCANHFFRGHREKRAGFHGGVIRDDHHQTPADTREPRDCSGRGRSAPFPVHLESGVNAQLKKARVVIEQARDPLARREPPFFVLRFDGLRAAAFVNGDFLILDFGDKFDHAAGIFLVRGGIGVDVRRDGGGLHIRRARRRAAARI